MEMKKRGLVLGIFLLVILVAGIVILQKSYFVSAASSTSGVVCAVHSTQGICVDVPVSDVTPGSETYTQSCTNGPGECALGTCVNAAGLCSGNVPSAECNTSNGETFYSNNLYGNNPPAVCELGCCVLPGKGGQPLPEAACDAAGINEGVTPTFYSGITDTLTCSAMAAPNAIGACVLSTSSGLTCKFTSQSNCMNITNNDASAFHNNWLCTNQILRNDGVNCTRTRETSCMTGQNEAIGTVDQVYFVDSCGNPANIYDASMVDSTPYWNYVAGTNGVPNESVAQPESPTNGNCDYYSSSICATYNSAIDGPNAPIGGHICRDISCKSGPFVQSFENTYGAIRKSNNLPEYPVNGETWCARANPANSSQLILGNNTGLTNAEGTAPGTVSSSLAKNEDLPGSEDYLLGCYDGKVIITGASTYRNQICVQNVNSNGVFQSSMVLNNFRSCYAQNNSKSCLAAGDCQWVVGVTNALHVDSKTGNAYVYNASTKSLVPMVDNSGFLHGVLRNNPDKVDDLLRPGAACVPKYAPGLDVSVNASETDKQAAAGLCNIGSMVCIVNFKRSSVSSLGSKDNGWNINAEDNGVNHVVTCLYNKNGGIYGSSADWVVNPNWEQNLSNMCFSLGDCGVSANYLNFSGLNLPSNIVKEYGNISQIPNSTNSS